METMRKTFLRSMGAAFSKEGLKFFARRVPSMIFWAAICTTAITLGQNLYYSNVSGDYLLNVKSVQAEPTIAQGDNLSFNFCREPRYAGIVSKSNVRSFYIVDEKGNRTPVGQNILPDVAYEVVPQPCILLEIKAQSIPQDLGRYYFCQQIVFNAYGYEKVANFCSTTWEVKKSDAAPTEDTTPPTSTGVE